MRPRRSPEDAAFRAHPRRAVRLHALVTHTVDGWQRFARIDNIGLGGARIAIDEPVGAGDVLTLSFSSPTLWDPIVVRGRIAWVSDVDIRAPERRAASVSLAGVSFEHRTGAGVYALHELLATLPE